MRRGEKGKVCEKKKEEDGDDENMRKKCAIAIELFMAKP